MFQRVMGLMVLSLALVACPPENPIGPPNLLDPGRPNVGDRCRPETEQSVPNAGCDGCRESALTCYLGVWDCVRRPGICTPVTIGDASVDVALDAVPTDSMVADRPIVSSDAPADAVIAADRAPEAATPDVAVSIYCPTDPNVEGSPCTNYAGACAQVGVWRCSVTGRRRCVSPLSGIPMPEACNGIDDDCDGQVDEGILSYACSGSIPSASIGRGICRQGTRTCTGGRWGDCLGLVEPRQVETCGNGLDDDCDGQVDQGCCGSLGYTPGPCTRGDGACLRNGVIECRSGQVQCSVVAGTPVSEICGNGRDDDCDGRTDEPPCAPP